MTNKFWKWYDSKYSVIVPLTAALFLLQLVHLYWLTTDIVFVKLFGQAFFHPNAFWRTTIALVDYTEIPAIIASSLLYINSLRSGFNFKSLLFLFLINTQWIHLFWITDEIIYAQFTGAALITIPLWLSWTAILIDYLELPVMVDTSIKAIRLLRAKKV